MQDKTFLKIITWAPLFFIPFVVIIVLMQTMKVHNQSFDDNIKRLEAELLNEEKKAIEAKVLSTIDLIVYQKSIIKNDLMERVKKRVDNAHKIAQAIYSKYKSTKTEEEIKDIIITTLRPMIWNGGESFIWILDFKGVFQLAPEYLRHLEGKSIINLQDAQGRYVIQEEIDICQKKGEGFIWDTFTKPNSENITKQYKQVAFVKAFGQYDWYLGDSEYLDTAMKKTDTQLLASIDKINATGSNYMFIMNMDGEMLLNSSMPKYESKNLFKTDDSVIKKVAKRMIDLLKKKDDDILSYEWINPSTGKIETKYTYIKRVPDSNWIVGSGFYMSTIENKIAKQKVNMYKTYNEKL